MNITAITVVYNTPDLVTIAIESIRKFYPHIDISMINCSNDGYRYRFSNCSIYNMKNNIGHGSGLHFGLERCPTRYALIFDSDIEMIKGGCLELMTKHFEGPKKIYGVGQVVNVNDEGRNVKSGIKYLHPHFALVDVTSYFSFHKAIHHGSPLLRAMKEIHEMKLSDMLVDFPVSDYVKHDGRGTRKLNPKEFLQNWEK